MTKLGTAYIEVEADLSKFDRQTQNRFKQVGEQFGRDLSNGFDKRTGGLLNPVSASLRDVAKDAKVAEKAVEKVGKQIADAAQKSVANLPAFDLSRTGRIDLQIAGAQADAQRLTAELAALSQLAPSIEVTARTAKAVSDLDRVEAKIAHLSGQRAEIKIDADQSLFSRLTDSVQGLFTSLGGSGGGGGLTGATSRVSAGFLSFGSSLGPLAAITAGLALTIGVSLAGALAAVVASMALAATGAAALGAAFAAVLGPVVVLAVAAAARIAKVFEALKAQDGAADEASRNAAAGSKAATAAAKQQATAARGLTEANRVLGTASRNAYREMADAAEQASDAIRGIANAQLSLEQAKLSTEQAKLALEAFRLEAGATGDAFGAIFSKFTDVAVDTSGLKSALTAANNASGGKLDQSEQLQLRQKILDVRAARLQEKDATDGVSDAITASSRAQEVNNQFKRDGIKASESYQAALRGVQAATLAIAEAQSNETATAAQEKAIQLTDKLSAREQILLTTIKRVRDQLRGAFKPATDAIFGGVIKALGRLPELINPLRENFKNLGQAIGDAFDKFSANLVGADSIKKLQAFIDGAAELAGPITDGLSALADIFTDIAQAALPYLVEGTRKVADKLREWAGATGDTKALNKVMEKLMGHLRTWLDVGASIARVFLAFLPHAAEQGKGLADSIKSVADRMTAWLKDDANRAQIKEFFDRAVTLTKDLAKILGVVAIAAVAFGSAAGAALSKVIDLLGGSKNAAKALLTILGTIAAFRFTKGAVGVVKDLTSGLRAAKKAATLLHAKLFAGDAAAGASTGLAGKAKGALKSIRTALASSATAIMSAGRAIGRRLITLFGVQGAIAGRAAGAGAAGASGLGSAGSKAKMTAVGTKLGRVFRAGFFAALVGIAAEITKKLYSALGVRKDAPTGFGEYLGSLLGVDLNPFAEGGIVPGHGNRDTVPGVLTPGEAITRKIIVERFGAPVFADINAGRLDPRVGYGPGARASVSTRPVRGPRFATGGLVAVRSGTVEQRPSVTINAPVTVAGGGPPDPVDLSMKLGRLIESRAGGSPRN